MSRIIPIDRGDVGTRVDRVLRRHLHDVPGVSRNTIQKLIDSGAVRVNDRPAPRASWRIAAGDQLTIELPETRERERPKAEGLPLDVVFEDEDLLVVNKPAGQVSHPAYRNTTGTLLNALLAHAHRVWTPALVNRLDKDTSGLVLVAKSPVTHAALQRAMQRNEVEKDYLAIVRGRPTPASGTIDLALDRDPCDRRRVMVRDPTPSPRRGAWGPRDPTPSPRRGAWGPRDRGGQPSVTRYERLEGLADGTISAVRCRLITGRTHQIRVHLAAKGWPIIGDSVYGVKDSRITRQALHAWRLEFTHPRSREHLTIVAQVPKDMTALLIPDPYSRRARRASTVPSAE